MLSKLMSLQEAAKLIDDGDEVTIGGYPLEQVPMALVRALVKRGVKDLTLRVVEQALSADLLIGAGCVSQIEYSYLGFEGFGLAPNFRRASEAGKIKTLENSCYAMIMSFRAGALGLPLLPLKGVMGSDLMRVRSDFKVVESPFGGEKVVTAPAIKPDVAIIHAHRVDELGNAQFEGAAWDDIIAEASDRVIVTAEQVVPVEEIRKTADRTRIPQFLVEAVVEAPFGAHPAACPFVYDTDEDHVNVYLEHTKDSAKFKEYLEKYVLQPRSLDEYLELVGGKPMMERLKW